MKKLNISPYACQVFELTHLDMKIIDNSGNSSSSSAANHSNRNSNFGGNTSDALNGNNVISIHSASDSNGANNDGNDSPKDGNNNHSNNSTNNNNNNSKNNCSDNSTSMSNTNSEVIWQLYCIVMELCEKENLSDIRKKHQGTYFGPKKGALYGIELIRALKSFHDIGYVHRDIKPVLFVCLFGCVRLCLFHLFSKKNEN